MQRTLWAGVALLLAGLAGYAVGIVTPYPGRAFSVTAVMVGVALLAIGAGDVTGDAVDGGRSG